MESWRSDGATLPFDTSTGITTAAVRSAYPTHQPDYSCRKVQGALEHLANIDLIDLCNEAKVEHCRATRDLRSCGRYVQSVLNSCGHASLCEECSQRCDACPICRFPIPKNANRLRLRLYYECIEAGLISKRLDDRFQEKNGEKQPAADVERLYSFFDIAIENNLTSLICHYITDVCMDESAISSDPVVALLLDEVVVKDWCKRTFKNIIADLGGIYELNVEEMKERSNTLLKYSAKLGSISNVLEVLESSFKGSLSVQLHDMHHLQENVLKTKQHAEMIVWCIRHKFLGNVMCHASFKSWHYDVRERKSAAIRRAWPDFIDPPADSASQNDSTLFIEDALSNLDMDQDETGDGLEIASLQKDGGLSFSRFKIEGMVGCYPFESLRSAIDTLFLGGSPDLVVAKQAILLYYLFDRFWKLPEEKWRHYIDDFAATFNITRHSILESFVFYLLDDHTDEALEEACLLLPEISGPTTHPKIAQVLLERRNPDAALMVLRWSGRDGEAEIPLGEAVTAVRVRVECGLIVEAFIYQRLLCTKVKERKLRHELYKDDSTESKDECQPWINWLEVLVTEICILCIRRNLVDRIIGLPWNPDEEKFLHKCLLDYALENPSSTAGSLLVVFYLQRYRYTKAYQVDCRLQSAEKDFISENSDSEDVKSRMAAASRWRAGLVDKSIQLLPDIEQQKLRSESFQDSVSPDKDLNDESKLPNGREPDFSSLLVPSLVDISHPSRLDNAITSSIPSVRESSSKLGRSVNIPHFTNYGSSAVSQMNIFKNAKKGMNLPKSTSETLKFDDLMTSASGVRPVPGTPFKEFVKGSLRIPQNGYLQNDWLNNASAEKERSGSIHQYQYSSPYFRRVAADPEISLASSNSGMFKGYLQDSLVKVSDKSLSPGRSAGAKSGDGLSDSMDISWSKKEEWSSAQTNLNGRPRWRSDDASDDEEQPSPDRPAGIPSNNGPWKGIRKSRLIRG